MLILGIIIGSAITAAIMYHKSRGIIHQDCKNEIYQELLASVVCRILRTDEMISLNPARTDEIIKDTTKQLSILPIKNLNKLAGNIFEFYMGSKSKESIRISQELDDAMNDLKELCENLSLKDVQ